MTHAAHFTDDSLNGDGAVVGKRRFVLTLASALVQFWVAFD